MWTTPWTRPAGRAALLLAATLSGAGYLAAQSVRVRVVEQDGSRAVAGALVSLRREGTTRAVVQSLSDAGGRAVLAAPGPGRFVIRADRIGYQGLTTEVIEVGSGDVTVQIVMPDVRVILPELTVRSTNQVCRLDRESGTLLATVWEEARKGLRGAELTQRVQPPELTVTTFERDYDRRDRITADQSRTARRRVARPFVAQNPGRLVEQGFLEERDGETWLSAPDAELLLSDEFLSVHCFRVVRGEGNESGLVGLAFEPIRGRRVPDVKGTLWLDRSNWELRYLDFSYTNLERRRSTGREGGRIDFSRLPTGGWIVSDWVIRMAIVATIRGRDFAGIPEDRDSVIGLRESGGRAVLASLETGPVAGSVAVGVVYDSIAGAPLSGAVVSISGGAFADTTDEAGSFRIEAPGQGNFLVTASHPRLDLYGLSLMGSVRLAREAQAQVNLATPAFESPGSEVCRGLVADSAARGALFGWMRDAQGRPLPGGSVRVTWRDAGRVARAGSGLAVITDGLEVTLTADERGTFRVCGVPMDGRLWVRAPRGFVAEPTAITMAGGSATIADLTLFPAGLAAARSAIVATVTSAPAGAPVREALLTLEPADDSVRTDPTGTARFPRVQAGRHLLQVRAFGFQGAEQEVLVADHDTARVSITLEPNAITLAELKVTEVARGVHPMLAGFEERRREGLGHYIGLETLKERESSPLSMMLRMSPGTRLVPLPSPCSGFAAATARSSSGIPRFCGTSPLANACYLSVYVDGSPVWTPLLSEPPPNVDEFMGNHLEGVEIYVGPSQTPAQYSVGGTDCGAIVLWRRVSP